MPQSITPSQIRQNNKKLIYQYIYDHHNASQLDIGYELRLSRPTVASKLSELEEEGLISKAGFLSSDQVGRKASAYKITEDYRIAIGVEIQKHVVKILYADLCGSYHRRMVYPVSYANSPEYISQVCGLINQYVSQLAVDDSRILGIGIAIPGLVSTDGSTVTYGRILECTGLRIDGFQSRLRFPCHFIHDAASAAQSELWASPDLDNFMYLNISVHLGAAMICNREVLEGLHGHAGTIEHIRIQPGGKPCYCGGHGCIETICSLDALTDHNATEENLKDFFGRLRSGDPAAQTRWYEYLKDLALTINTVHMVYDTVFVLGGYLAPYLEESDLDQIYSIIEMMTAFHEERNFLQISRMPDHNITIGAALPYIRDFLDSYSFA